MTDEETPEGGEYDLVMPFVLAASQGGPYDDTAFVAGWRLAELSTLLKTAEQFGLDVPQQTLYPSDEPQADLLAMRFGFTMQVKSYDEHWSVYTFTRNGVESIAKKNADTVRLAVPVCFNPELVEYMRVSEVIERLNEYADALDGGTDA